MLVLSAMDEFSLAQVNEFVLRRQHLAADSRSGDVVGLAGDIAGLHATGTLEPYIAAFARCRDFTRDDLSDALNVTRSLVKVRYVRATLYILPVEMVPVVHAALRSITEPNSRRYAEYMGVSRTDYDRVSPRVLELLKGRALKATEIKNDPGEDLHFPSLLNLMCDRGLLLRIQSGSDRQPGNYRYAVFKERLPDVNLDTYTEEEGTARLVRAYLDAFAPAPLEDIVWWTGLTRGKIQRAAERLGNAIVPVTVKNLADVCLMPTENLGQLRRTEPSAEHTVNLLPSLDPYLMGYKLRTRYLEADRYHYVFDRSGNATATVLLDGRVIGVWDISDEAAMKLFLFGKVAKPVAKNIDRAAQDMARFITDREIEIKHVRAMTPLTQRTAGGFMSPLRDRTE